MARIVRKKPFVRRRPCQFCSPKNTLEKIDYKDEATLSKLVNLQGKILSSRITGTCAKHQRAVSLAIKRARFVAILPYIGSIRKDKDVKVEKTTHEHVQKANKEVKESVKAE
ncbi:small subunit ribosomal protein S18 [Metamycoplasma subdolum]|uniref:Small ribosomal subunit protein bS18 n=1 Tax=Metamycoplasma subdolum TaxID=92407 RepID=A0A3M0A3V7_9BACT|nr:30S ribosomal protein S18 [Metamycoplasma subdolum]RMA77428.1 small subunit ribosomal protein S18 [Metamycoplasma subdolum]